MAESEGFEPSKPAKACQFSRLVYSTALPALRRPFYWFWRLCSMNYRVFTRWAAKKYQEPLTDLGGAAHVLLKCLRNRHRSVFFLVIFKHSDQCTANSKAAAVHGVDELGLTALRFKSDIGSAGLEVLKVRARADLAVILGSWKPHFQVKYCRRV